MDKADHHHSQLTLTRETESPIEAATNEKEKKTTSHIFLHLNEEDFSALRLNVILKKSLTAITVHVRIE